ncbi:MAG: L,D-transpeptidase [Gemmatimonadaceae bacterium]
MTQGRAVLVSLLVAVAALAAVSAVAVARTLEIRYGRDVSRMVFNDNLQLLAELRRRAGLEGDSLNQVLASTPLPSPGQPYIVVSIEERRLWFRRGDSVLFTAQVATGSGKVLERRGNDQHWRFETPRGRLAVVSRETDPVWIPPDWHYVELAQRRGLGVVRLLRGQRLPVGDGSYVTVAGSDVVMRSADGRQTSVSVSDGTELVVGGNVVIPPFGTSQRKYHGVLGTHRLNIGDGYALHGTNRPETIGRAVSHGCVRLRNEDIAVLYEMVSVGTPVFIY